MFESIDIMQIISLVGGLVGGGGLMAWSKHSKAKAKAEADKAIADGFHERIKDLHENLKIVNADNKELNARIIALEHELVDKTEYVRQQVQKVWEAEQEVNRVNRELVTAKEEIGKLKLRVEHYKEWRCYWHDCRDERGRKPKQEKEHTEDGIDPE